MCSNKEGGTTACHSAQRPTLQPADKIRPRGGASTSFLCTRTKKTLRHSWDEKKKARTTRFVQPTIDVTFRTRPHTIVNINSIVSTGKEDTETSDRCLTGKTTHNTVLLGTTTEAAVCRQNHIERLSLDFLSTDKENTKFAWSSKEGSHNTGLLGQRSSLQFTDKTSRKAQLRLFF